MFTYNQSILLFVVTIYGKYLKDFYVLSLFRETGTTFGRNLKINEQQQNCKAQNKTKITANKQANKQAKNSKHGLAFFVYLKVLEAFLSCKMEFRSLKSS